MQSVRLIDVTNLPGEYSWNMFGEDGSRFCWYWDDCERTNVILSMMKNNVKLTRHNGIVT